ncbi:MAG: anaerobic glycerol-3-phosphate dehydrogenase subunit B [Tidjanibacter sp.]|nr:anaerobic glycerol-3-phosphate dehydrogenase subunit B [Tidjanibacter sp.]
MRYDTIIIGGGLAGLVSGIELARSGSRVAIISSGKSALHFCSGSFEFWSEGMAAVGSIAEHNPDHPYSKIDPKKIARYTEQTKDIFARAGMPLVGSAEANHLRLTPLGALKPAWLTMDEYVTFEAVGVSEYRSVVIVAIEGYLDFYPEFIAKGLEQMGLECHIREISLAEFNRLRQSATEMRAVNLSRTLKGSPLREFAQRVKALVEDEDLVLLPAIFGLGEERGLQIVEEIVGRKVKVAATVSASASGVRMQKRLTDAFQSLGGVFIGGDRVVGCTIDESRIVSLNTANHEEEEFVAENYILATGSFFGRGIVATPEEVYEPILGLDVVPQMARKEWYADDILDAQPFQKFGVATDSELHPMIDGRVVENLYAVGSILSGADAVKEGCGAGVVIATALMVAENILAYKHK